MTVMKNNYSSVEGEWGEYILRHQQKICVIEAVPSVKQKRFEIMGVAGNE